MVHPKKEEVVYTLEGRDVIQMDLERLETWAHANLRGFSCIWIGLIWRRLD